MFLTVEDAKRHINVDADYTADDDYIADLIEVSEQAVQTHIDRPIDEIVTDDELPAPLLHAVRFLVGQLYANREPASFVAAYTVPYTYDYLISLYKRYTIQ